MDFAEYMLDNEKYKEQQQRLRNSRALVLATITPDIRHCVSSGVKPHNIVAAVEFSYMMDDAQAVKLCRTKMRNIQVRDFANITDLINILTTYQQDIHELSGLCDDFQIIAQVMLFLPASYAQMAIILSGCNDTRPPRWDIYTFHKGLLFAKLFLEYEEMPAGKRRDDIE